MAWTPLGRRAENSLRSREVAVSFEYMASRSGRLRARRPRAMQRAWSRPIQGITGRLSSARFALAAVVLVTGVGQARAQAPGGAQPAPFAEPAEKSPTQTAPPPPAPPQVQPPPPLQSPAAPQGRPPPPPAPPRYAYPPPPGYQPPAQYAPPAYPQPPAYPPPAYPPPPPYQPQYPPP